MSNRAKNILTLIGFILTLILCYQLAISRTFEQKKRFNTLKEEAVLFENIPKQRSILKQKQTYYDSILNRYQLKNNSLQNSLLNTINLYSEAHQLKVIAFEEPHIFIENNLKIKTYQFTLEGNYNSILGLIYKLEHNTKFGEISNVNFQKIKNFRTGKYFLQAKVCLQSFE